MRNAVSLSQKHITVDDAVKQRDEMMGITPMPLDDERLLKRIKQGGWSGEYLAEAFLSAYGMRPFNQSLHKLINLDAEGFRLFHQICHIRHVPGWNDEELYEVALKIAKIYTHGQ